MPAPENPDSNPYAPPKPRAKRPKQFRKIKVRKLTEADRAELARGKARKAIREAEHTIRGGLTVFAVSWGSIGLFQLLDLPSARNWLGVGIALVPFALAAMYAALIGIAKIHPSTCAAAGVLLYFGVMLTPELYIPFPVFGLVQALAIGSCIGGILLLKIQTQVYERLLQDHHENGWVPDTSGQDSS